MAMIQFRGSSKRQSHIQDWQKISTGKRREVKREEFAVPEIFMIMAI